VQEQFEHHGSLFNNTELKGKNTKLTEPLVKFVTPAKAGVQPCCSCPQTLDSGLRRNDGNNTGKMGTVPSSFGGCPHFAGPSATQKTGTATGFWIFWLATKSITSAETSDSPDFLGSLHFFLQKAQLTAESVHL